LEAEPALFQSAQKVVIGGAPFGGDERQTERKLGQRLLTVPCQQTGGFESLECLLTALGEKAESEDRIDFANDKLEPAKRGIEIDTAPTTNLLSLGELLTRVGQ
jgi:hypothetical protein